MTSAELKTLIGWWLTLTPKKRNHGVTSNSLIYRQNTNIQWGNVLQYQFYNLGNQPVMVNGHFLDRYYAGSLANPTVISGSHYSWEPPMKAGEFDTGNYGIVFDNTFYTAVTAAPRLLVVTKLSSPGLDSQR